MTKAQLAAFVDFADCLQANIPWAKGGRCEVSLTVGDIKNIKRAADVMEQATKQEEATHV